MTIDPAVLQKDVETVLKLIAEHLPPGQAAQIVQMLEMVADSPFLLDLITSMVNTFTKHAATLG